MEYKKVEKSKQLLADQYLIESTGRAQMEPVFNLDGSIKHLSKQRLPFNSKNRKLFKPKRCYICKEHFSEVHHFYPMHCPKCAKIDFSYRSNKADLSDRQALVTGGRIKIGYEITLKLLRAGAHVMITTRFKHDAARRYANEPDFEKWQERLTIYALDLKHIPSVELFIQYLINEKHSLDILINNAAQTLRKSQHYFSIMAQNESELDESINPKLLGHFVDKMLEQEQKLLTLDSFQNASPSPNYDEFGDPVDTNEKNTWNLPLESVSTLELIETQVINAMAPFLLTSQLKPLMLKAPFDKRFIVNVSAMEGQFNRANKTPRHPHTNMAKAALNMMTRTSGTDYAKQGIYMSSVDTGWVSEENPLPIKIKKRLKGIVPPLDCIDGASRVLAPIFDTLKGEDVPFGVFFKDYNITQW